MVFLTSDFHFNHTNISGASLSSWPKGYREFSDVGDMNETILRNLNYWVKPTDTLYFLGDFAFGDKQKIPALWARIACQDIRVIFGNHDTYLRKILRSVTIPNITEVLGDYHELRIPKGEPGAGKLLVMSHYPLQSWNEQGRGSYHVHGHCHGSLRNFNGRMMDVGVDTNYFRPYTLEQVVRRLDEIKPTTSDHHDKDS